MSNLADRKSTPGPTARSATGATVVTVRVVSTMMTLARYVLLP
jgi:hypothetical protein